MEVASFLKTLVPIYKSTYDYIPGNCIVHIHHCKSHVEQVNFFSPEVGTLETLLL